METAIARFKGMEEGDQEQAGVGVRWEHGPRERRMEAQRKQGTQGERLKGFGDGSPREKKGGDRTE